MEIILLERVPKLGQTGDVVRVRDGYARNFLLPGRKALRATEANRKQFESQRAQLEARDLELRSDAEQIRERLDGQEYIVIRQAGETGQLYGSVSTRDIAEAVTAGGFTITRNQVDLVSPIKSIGRHKITITLYGDVEASIGLNIARSQEEAERQARGEDTMARENLSMDDLGLEVGAALAEYEGSDRGYRGDEERTATSDDEAPDSSRS